MLRSTSACVTCLDCQGSAVLLPHIRCVLTAEDLKFRFHTSALPWLSKTWCFAFALPLCLDCKRSEVPLLHFRSVLTAKNVKFRFPYWSARTSKYVKFCFRTSDLPWLAKIWRSAFLIGLPGLPNMWSSSSVFHLCLDFQRFAVSLLHFCSILTAKDLKLGFSYNTLPSLPDMGSSASALPFCFDCKRSVVSDFRSAFIPIEVNALLLCLDCQRSVSSVPL